MHQKISEMIVHMSYSHQHMARVIDAKRQVAVRMSQIIHALPDRHPEFSGVDGLIENSAIVTKNIVAYLNSIADLQEAVAENLTHVMKEIGDQGEE
ncbi:MULTISPECIES: nucleoside-diphosphate sugar epimerase [unclassified Paenibacillus]|uniref:nucleoside-diphosphate sugar epimerase n=1 Tax=unclassified Paenibacillus TaxID=185978 RepID=UPI001C0FBC12|nr:MULTISPECIES: nucleoside-diphosphate sugar epimerase [unclassified Paenibacillus]MBU5440839.1 nucleoside-diphosphate sugar epimerase [Paenibacillus sp. MSJ-34]CAH0118462.1 hypothetical protein PAE9249_00951 [Paenibacillus sp. CECT 9249]